MVYPWEAVDALKSQIEKWRSQKERNEKESFLRNIHRVSRLQARKDGYHAGFAAGKAEGRAEMWCIIRDILDEAGINADEILPPQDPENPA